MSPISAFDGHADDLPVSGQSGKQYVKSQSSREQTPRRGSHPCLLAVSVRLKVFHAFISVVPIPVHTSKGCLGRVFAWTVRVCLDSLRIKTSRETYSVYSVYDFRAWTEDGVRLIARKTWRMCTQKTWHSSPLASHFLVAMVVGFAKTFSSNVSIVLLSAQALQLSHAHSRTLRVLLRQARLLQG